MNRETFDEWLSGIDFAFWATAQHKVSPTQFFERHQSEGAVLVDLRDAVELGHLTLPFALHIPMNELPALRQEVPSDRLVVLFCSSGVRAAVAFAYLQFYGLDNVRVLEGGYQALVAELKPGKIHRRAQA